MIKHIVLMKVREDVNEQELTHMYSLIKELKHLLPGIMSFTFGNNISTEGYGQGYNQAFSMDFVDQEYLQAYLVHPKHQDVVAQMQTLLVGDNGVLVFDYQL